MCLFACDHRTTVRSLKYSYILSLALKTRYLFIFVPPCAHFIKKNFSIIILQFFFSSFVAPSTLMSTIKKCICEISQHLYSTYGTYSKKSEKSFFHSKNIKAPVIFFSIHVYVQYLTFTHRLAFKTRPFSRSFSRS